MIWKVKLFIFSLFKFQLNTTLFCYSLKKFLVVLIEYHKFFSSLKVLLNTTKRM